MTRSGDTISIKSRYFSYSYQCVQAATNAPKMGPRRIGRPHRGRGPPPGQPRAARCRLGAARGSEWRQSRASGPHATRSAVAMAERRLRRRPTTSGRRSAPSTDASHSTARGGALAGHPHARAAVGNDRCGAHRTPWASLESLVGAPSPQRHGAADCAHAAQAGKWVEGDTGAWRERRGGSCSGGDAAARACERARRVCGRSARTSWGEL